MISCSDCDNIYISEAERAIQKRIKEQERDIHLVHTEMSVVSVHANKTGHSPDWENIKCLDRDSHWYS